MNLFTSYIKGKPRQKSEASNKEKDSGTAARQSVVRHSGVPSTIEEGSPNEPDFTQWEAQYAEKLPPPPAFSDRGSRFSFSPAGPAGGRNSDRLSFAAPDMLSVGPRGSIAPSIGPRGSVAPSAAGNTRGSRLSFAGFHMPGGTDARNSRFSFGTQQTQTSEEPAEYDYEAERENFRKSMTGAIAHRRSMWGGGDGMDNDQIIEEEEEEDMMDEDISEEDLKEQELDHENILDELKHEIMVNYLFQQQCARLWIADGTGEVEGVMLKKSRGNYLACPPALAESIFAESCVELNVQVSLVSMLLGKTNVSVCHDRQFTSDQDLPRVVARRRRCPAHQRFASADLADNGRAPNGSQASICSVCCRRVAVGGLGRRCPQSRKAGQVHRGRAHGAGLVCWR